LTLARKAFFKRERPLPLDYPVPGADTRLGEELLRPTLIYVREVMEIVERIPNIKALVNITGDGLLNLNRVENQRVGFVVDEMPETPSIFKMIQEFHPICDAEMFQVFNMGIGFCVVSSENDVDSVLSILENHHRKAWVIGRSVEDPTKGVYLPRQRLRGHGKRFCQE
jgi:phosphoribosylformylglycinamidine cyclo-ligase